MVIYATSHCLATIAHHHNGAAGLAIGGTVTIKAVASSPNTGGAVLASSDRMEDVPAVRRPAIARAGPIVLPIGAGKNEAVDDGQGDMDRTFEFEHHANIDSSFLAPD